MFMLSLSERLKILKTIMKKYEDFGAMDSEGYHALARVERHSRIGDKLVLTPGDWQLYQTQDGWREAEVELCTYANQINEDFCKLLS